MSFHRTYEISKGSAKATIQVEDFIVQEVSDTHAFTFVLGKPWSYVKGWLARHNFTIREVACEFDKETTDNQGRPVANRIVPEDEHAERYPYVQ